MGGGRESPRITCLPSSTLYFVHYREQWGPGPKGQKPKVYCPVCQFIISEVSRGQPQGILKERQKGEKEWEVKELGCWSQTALLL